MGQKNSKSSLRDAIVHLSISADSVRVHDDKFWNQIWAEDIQSSEEILKGISVQSIRMLRDGSPRNFSTLTYKMVERLCFATGTLCNTQSQQTAVINATRILIRLIPCIFEDKNWRHFFTDNFMSSADQLWKEPNLVYPKDDASNRNYESYLPFHVERSDVTNQGSNIGTFNQPNDNARNIISNGLTAQKEEAEVADLLDNFCTYEEKTEMKPKLECTSENEDKEHQRSSSDRTLLESLVLSICDLLFCPEFTVPPLCEKYLSNTVDAPPEDLKSLATFEYVWEPGVGFGSSSNSTTSFDKSRIELLRLLICCFSDTLYEDPQGSINNRNLWIGTFASNLNRHALPLFTSLLNLVLIYRPSRLSPLNNLLFDNNRKLLVELAVQLLIVVLDYKFYEDRSTKNKSDESNLFIDYMSRIHRDEDFSFIVEGFTVLLNNRFEQGYLLNPIRQVIFEDELLILLWQIANLNKKFVRYLLKSNEILDIVVMLLFHLNENFQDPSKTGLIHIGVFNLLILSGEREFGVRLNKPYLTNRLTNLPAFSGTHADLMIIVFHKLILYGCSLTQLYDFLLTILVNISPFLKILSTLACKCLIQLFETFSSPYVIFTEPNYHQLILFLLEIFNNLIQYQFDGNISLVYVILHKKDSFIELSNLPSSQYGIDKILKKLIKRKLLCKEALQQSEQNEDGDITSLGLGCINQLHSVALVSTDQQPTSSSNSKPQTPRQGVSLVATPDICLVTQKMHQISLDSKKSANVSPENSPKIFFGDELQEDNSEDMLLLMDSSTTSIRSKSRAPHNNKSTDCSSGLNSIRTTNTKWKPSPAWVKEWKRMLPLQTILKMIEVLTPQIEQLKQANRNIQLGEAEITNFLQSVTLVGLLPVPHPIVIRKYRTNDQTTLWFRTCTWGLVYVRHTIWTDTKVRLVKVV